MSTPPRELGVGYAAATATLLSWVGVALLLEHFTGLIDVWTANGWRYGLAALLWAPLAIWVIARRGVRSIPWRTVTVPAVLWFAGQVQFAASFYFVGPALVTFMVRVQILCVILFSALLIPSARRLLRRPGVWIGIALMFSGAAGMLSFGSAPPKVDDWTGVLLAAGSGATFGAYGVALRFVKPAPAQADVPRLNALERFAFIAPMIGVGMVALMLIFGRDFGAAAASLGAGELALLALSSILGVMVGHLAYFIAIDRIGVVAASSIIQVQPFMVLAVSAFWFRESFTWPQVAFGVVLVAGAATLLRVQTNRT